MKIQSPEQARFNMIEQQVRPWNVLDPKVLDLLARMRREDFVAPQHQALAFADLELPLSQGQCMLAPKVEARMLQDLQLQPSDKVLEIGTGSGFMAALLSRQAQRVISLEIEPELAAQARTHLQKAGVHNVDVRCTNGAGGLAAEAPFDAIVLSGSVQEIPAALLQQLQIGGRLIAIVGEDPVMHATLVTRTSASEFRTEQRWETVATPLQQFPAPSAFTF